MIRFRLHGTESEIKKFVLLLRNSPKVEILSESALYADRGKSQYYRCYLDIEMNEIIEAVYEMKNDKKLDVFEELLSEMTIKDN